MTIYITIRFNERGEAHIDESQLANLHFDTNLEKINELVTNTIYLKSEDKELVQDLKQLVNQQS